MSKFDSLWSSHVGTSQSVLIRGVSSFQRWIVLCKWTPSNPTTLGTSQSVLIRGVSSFQSSRLCYILDSSLYFDYQLEQDEEASSEAYVLCDVFCKSSESRTSRTSIIPLHI